jgi:hypothetical protein
MAYNKAFNPDALPAYELCTCLKTFFTDSISLFLVMQSLKKLPRQLVDFKTTEDLLILH